jgi:hypothetical protein
LRPPPLVDRGTATTTELLTVSKLAGILSRQPPAICAYFAKSMAKPVPVSPAEFRDLCGFRVKFPT